LLAQESQFFFLIFLCSCTDSLRYYSLQFEKQDPHQLYDEWVKNVNANQQTEDSILAKLTKPDIKAAEFSKTFLTYAKEQQQPFADSEANQEVDVVMAENGNVGGDTLANPVASKKSMVEVRTINRS
jgi:hypothetical protein